MTRRKSVKDALQEVRASGEESEVMDPVDTGNTKRMADKSDNKEPMPKPQDPGNQATGQEMPVSGDKVEMGTNNTRMADKSSKQDPMPKSQNPGNMSTEQMPLAKGKKVSKLKEMLQALSQMDSDQLDEYYNNIVNEESDEEAKVADLVKEDLTDLFSGNEAFTEDFKTKAFVIFESALLTKLEEEKANLAERYEADLQEKVDALKEEYEDKINDYVEYAVKEWVSENEKVFRESIKSDLFDSLVEGMKNLFEDHNISFSEESVDMIEDLNTKIENLQNEMNEKIEENRNLEKSIFEKDCERAFLESVSDLSDVQKERVAKIADNLSFESVDELREKLEVIKESYSTSGTPVKKSSANDLHEEVNVLTEETTEEDIPSHIRAAREAISRSVRSKI